MMVRVNENRRGYSLLLVLLLTSCGDESSGAGSARQSDAGSSSVASMSAGGAPNTNAQGTGGSLGDAANGTNTTPANDDGGASNVSGQQAGATSSDGGDGATVDNSNVETGGTAGSNTTGAGGAEATAGMGGLESAGGAVNAAGGGVNSGGELAPCLEFAEPMQVGELEALPSGPSGIAASRAQAGVIYFHTDAGDGAEFFASDSSGADLAVVQLTGATHVDYEDISLGQDAAGDWFVFVADIGDNAARTGNGTPRDELHVYRLPEPSIDLGQTSAQLSSDDWERLVFTYPDQAFDAEALFVDPVSRDIIMITKETSGAFQVFRAPSDLPADTSTALELVATVPSGDQRTSVTAGDISPTGDRVLLRTTNQVLIWPRAAGANWAEVFAEAPSVLPSVSEPQGEGITFGSDGASWFSAGEQQADLFEAQATCN